VTKIKSDGHRHYKPIDQLIVIEWETVTGISLADMDQRECLSTDMPDYKFGSIAKIAARFKVSIGTVTKIIRRQKWKVKQGIPGQIYRIR
jgi:hypothetical protein